MTIEPQVYCGHCYPCRHGKYNLCEELKVMGFQTTGTASEFFAVDASKVTSIPEEMSYEKGAMIEPLAVAVHAVKQVGDVTGMNIAVLVAVFAGMAEIDLAVANDHELDIKSTMMYRHDDYIDAIQLVNEDKVHLRPLISKTFPFKDYLKAYQYIDDNRETTMKVIINVQEK